MTSLERAPLDRPDRGRWLAGVAAGAARWLEWPVWMLRAAFVLLCFLFGLGLFLYLAGWLLIPGEGRDRSIAQESLAAPSVRRWAGAALVAFAVLLLVGRTGLIRGDLLFALVLVAVGVLLYRGGLGLGEGSASPPPAEAPRAPAPPGDAKEAAAGRAPPRQSTQTAAAGAAPSAAPRPPRRRSFLGRITLAAALIAVGLLGLLDAVVAGFDAYPRHYMALLVAVIGAGLVVGAWFGRSYGLAALGIALAPVMLLTPVVEKVDFGRIGGLGSFEYERTYYRPVTAEEAESVYRLGAGMMVIDLREVDFGGRTLEVTADLELGELIVLLPGGAAADVTGEVAAGSLRVEDYVLEGVNLEAVRRLEGAGGRLFLDAEVGIGSLEVYRGRGYAGLDYWIYDPYEPRDGYAR